MITEKRMQQLSLTFPTFAKKFQGIIFWHPKHQSMLEKQIGAREGRGQAKNIFYFQSTQRQNSNGYIFIF
jgi:tryptophan 2,3-dioxygenase